MARQTPLEGKALQDYIARKRATTGALSSWSDSITFEAMAEMLERPVMQVTYPRYVDGEKRPELEPRFFLSSCGSREKLPVFIHYNGINHYNTFVPKAYPVSVQKQAAKPVAKPTGMMRECLQASKMVPYQLSRRSQSQLRAGWPPHVLESNLVQ
jgi:hypothetical protein